MHTPVLRKVRWPSALWNCRMFAGQNLQRLSQYRGPEVLARDRLNPTLSATGPLGVAANLFWTSKMIPAFRVSITLEHWSVSMVSAKIVKWRHKYTSHLQVHRHVEQFEPFLQRCYRLRQNCWFAYSSSNLISIIHLIILLICLNIPLNSLSRPLNSLYHPS